MVYVFLAEGFETVEALGPVDCLRRAGIETATVGVSGEYVTSSHGVVVKADLTAPVKDENVEMIILPGGGPGTKNLRASEMVADMIEWCVGRDIPVAAICAAPGILGERGYLKGRHATSFPTEEPKMDGAIYEKCPACEDGIFVTGRSAGHSLAFGLKLVEKLRGKEAAEKVRTAMFTDV